LTFKRFIVVSSARRRNDGNPSLGLDASRYATTAATCGFLIWYFAVSHWYNAVILFVVGSGIAFVLADGIQYKMHGWGFFSSLVPPLNLGVEARVARLGVFGCFALSIVLGLLVSTVYINIPKIL
jgi:hypothetical protein